LKGRHATALLDFVTSIIYSRRRMLQATLVEAPIDKAFSGSGKAPVDPY
jgi:hypothetical protein